MHCYACYWYALVSKISFEIPVFNFGYLFSRHYLCVQEHEDLWLLLEVKRGLQAKMFGEHCLMP
jgi:hypothetical protein